MTSLNLATVAVASAGLTTATTAYIDGDQLGTVMTFTLTNAGIILSAELVDKAKIIGAVDLFLFNASPTLAADNAPFTVSDADMLNCIGVIEFPYPKNLPSAMVNALAHIDSLGIPTGASSTVYGALVTRAGHTFFGAVGDLQVRLNYSKDV
jgi:hypothetical protein